MSKPIDARALDVPNGWVTPISSSDVVGCEPLTSPFRISTSLSHAYSFNATSSTSSLVLSCNTPDNPHPQIVTSTDSAASHFPSSYYQQLPSTLSGNPTSDALHFFNHQLPWSATRNSIQTSCEPSHHRGPFVPGTEEPTVKPAPSSLPHGNGGSHTKVDGEGRVVRAPLHARHDNYLASPEAARFAPGPKELASLALPFKAEGPSYIALLTQGGYETLYGDTEASVCSDRHFDKDGADIVGGRTKSTLEALESDGTSASTPTVERGLNHGEVVHHFYSTVGSVGMFDPVAHISPWAHTTSSARTYICNLKASAHAQHAYITSVVRLRDNDAVRHQSLILGIARHGMSNFSLRIDRFRDHTLSLARFALRRGKSNALDTVTVSENSYLLHDVRSSEEAQLDLPQPVPLLEFGRVLEVVLSECGSYDVFAENCWFMVSMLEELFTEMFGARYVKSGARQSRLARQTRTRIRSKLGLRDSE